MVHTPFQAEPFDIEKQFFVLKEMKVSGRTLLPGDHFPWKKWKVDKRRLQQLFNHRQIGHVNPLTGSLELGSEPVQEELFEFESPIGEEEAAIIFDSGVDQAALDALFGQPLEEEKSNDER